MSAVAWRSWGISPWRRNSMHGKATYRDERAGHPGECCGQDPDAQVMTDLDAAAAWAATHGGGAKLGITGFCWAAGSYGCTRHIIRRSRPASPGMATSRRGVSPGDKGAVQVVDRIKAPILGLYGGADSGIPTIRSRKCGRR